MTNTAIMFGKRKVNGIFIVQVRCGCGHEMTLAFAGWSAIVCTGCGTDIERPKLRTGRRGRPSLGAAARDNTVRVRVSNEELARLMDVAKMRHTTASDVLRDAIRLDARISELTPIERECVARLVNHIASFGGDKRARLLNGVRMLSSR